MDETIGLRACTLSQAHAKEAAVKMDICINSDEMWEDECGEVGRQIAIGHRIGRHGTAQHSSE